jgi:hypothetical protein
LAVGVLVVHCQKIMALLVLILFLVQLHPQVVVLAVVRLLVALVVLVVEEVLT